ncbi:MAG TPA: triose-phosphate isomerase [Rubrivivax sp.]|nr:triose-phosphate isomerase [Burkholderiales bacterium]HNT37495.1 triose-phosphate isomerase [Rubrivivax sp.]
MTSRRKLVVGNWKMHGSRAANAELLRGIVAAQPFAAEMAVCAPFPYLADVAAAVAGTALAYGAQDCSAHEQGAYTGEVSAAMLADLGCRFVIVGHSERRALHGESDRLVAEKARAALAHGLVPIVCVGETLLQREHAQTEIVVQRQLAAVLALLGERAGEIVVAYEPVWAIGTGRTATPDQAQAVHAVLRAQLQAATGGGARMRILYGGSVKADNAATLFARPDIDGGLIGGAALKATDFVAIGRAAG